MVIAKALDDRKVIDPQRKIELECAELAKKKAKIDRQRRRETKLERQQKVKCLRRYLSAVARLKAEIKA